MSNSPPLRAVSLIRMSTNAQENSPDRQRMMFREYCQRYDLIDAGEFADLGVSASKTPLLDRPGVKQLLTEASRGLWQIVYCEEISRAARKGEEAVMLEARLGQHGVLLVSHNDDPRQKLDTHIRKLMTFLHGWRAEGEVRDLGRRVADTQRKLVAEGKYIGGFVTLGLKWDKQAMAYEVDPPGAETATRVYEAYVEGRSLVAAADLLNASGLPSPRGGPWRCSTISRLLQHPAYRGNLRLKRVVYPADLPEVIPAALVKEVDRLRELQRGRPQRSASSTTTKALFSGLLQCPECGGWLTCGSNRGRATGTRLYIYYRCNHAYQPPRPCNWRRTLHQIKLEKLLLPLIVERLRDYRPSVTKRTRPDRRREARVRELQQERERILNLHIKGRIPEERMEELLEDVTRRLEECRAEVAEPPEPEMTAAEARQMVKMLTKVWPLLEVPAKRELLQMLLVCVIPDPDDLPNSRIVWRQL